MATDEVKDRVRRNAALLDRMTKQMVNRAGSEDTAIAISEFIESFPDDETKISELMFLVLAAVESAAQASTVVNIWDPQRRVDPSKAVQLGKQATSAFADLQHELRNRTR